MPAVGGQRTSWQVALLVGTANLVVCAGVGTTLLLIPTNSTEPESASPSSQTTAISIWPPPASTPSSSAQATVSTTPPVQEFTVVTGPAGITTVIPAGWTPEPTSSAGSVQATDPTDSTRFVRYGGSPALPGPMLDVHLAAESDFASQPNRPGYCRVTLEEVSVRGYPAIDWEFEWDAPEGRRHVHIVYWQANGIEYFVYLSTKLADWSQYSPILTAMLEKAEP